MADDFVGVLADSNGERFTYSDRSDFLSARYAGGMTVVVDSVEGVAPPEQPPSMPAPNDPPRDEAPVRIAETETVTRRK